MQVLKFTYYFLIFSSFVILVFNRKRLPEYCKFILSLLPLSLISQIIEEILQSKGINHLYLLHTYSFLEFILISLFYYSIFSGSLFKKITIGFILSYFLANGIYYYNNPVSFKEKQFIDFTIESLLVCLMVVMLFIEMLKIRHKIELRYYTAFWLNGLHLIFYGGCLFVMGFFYYLSASEPDLAMKFLGINHFLNLMLYLGYSIIFLCTATPRTLSS